MNFRETALWLPDAMRTTYARLGAYWTSFGMIAVSHAAGYPPKDILPEPLDATEHTDNIAGSMSIGFWAARTILGLAERYTPNASPAKVRTAMCLGVVAASTAVNMAIESRTGQHILRPDTVFAGPTGTDITYGVATSVATSMVPTPYHKSSRE